MPPNMVYVRIDQLVMPCTTRRQTRVPTGVGRWGPPSSTVLFRGGTAAHMWIILSVSDIH